MVDAADRETPAARGDVRGLFGVEARELWRLLAVLFGGLTAWSLHLGVCYLAVTLECTAGWSGSDAVVGIATLLFGVAAAAPGVVGYRMLRRQRDDRQLSTLVGESHGHRELVLVVGIVLAFLSVLGIAYAGLAPLLVPTCG